MQENNKVPIWFWVLLSVCLIWNLLGLMAFFQQLTVTGEQITSMSPDEQLLYAELPSWVTIAFAFAVFGGSLGCLLMLLRKALAKQILMLSLVGVLVQMYHSFFISQAFDVYGPGAAVMPVMVVVVAILLVWLAYTFSNKGWLN